MVERLSIRTRIFIAIISIIMLASIWQEAGTERIETMIFHLKSHPGGTEQIKSEIARSIEAAYGLSNYDYGFLQFLKSLSVKPMSGSSSPLIFVELKSIGLYRVIGDYWPIEAKITGLLVRHKGNGIFENIELKHMGKFKIFREKGKQAEIMMLKEL